RSWMRPGGTPRRRRAIAAEVASSRHLNTPTTGSMLPKKSKKRATHRAFRVIHSGAVRVSLRLLAGFVLACLPAILSAQTPALGPEFQVNTYTTNSQAYPSIHGGPSGCFIVTWESVGQDAPPSSGIAAQSYNQDGNTINGEFVVNSYTTGNQQLPT